MLRFLYFEAKRRSQKGRRMSKWSSPLRTSQVKQLEFAATMAIFGLLLKHHTSTRQLHQGLHLSFLACWTQKWQRHWLILFRANQVCPDNVIFLLFYALVHAVRPHYLLTPERDQPTALIEPFKLLFHCYNKLLTWNWSLYSYLSWIF